MPGPPKPQQSLLLPAVEAARRVLGRLDGDEVPAELQKVASYTGGRLPPPLRSRLLSEIDRNEWLRSLVADELHIGDKEKESPAEAASRLFLWRPNDWWEQLAVLLADREEDVGAQQQQRFQSTIADLEAQLAEARARARTAKGEHERSALEARRKVEDARRRSRSSRQREEARVEDLEDAAAAARRRAESAEEALDEAKREAARLRDQLHTAKKERAEAERRLTARHRSSGSAHPGPLELARMIDRSASRARPVAANDPVPEADLPGPLQLPARVRPDDAAAVDWLLGGSRPFLLLVDGYNVAFAISAGVFDTLARTRVTQELGRLRRLAKVPVRVVAVYDSQVSAEREEADQHGVEVVFAEEGKTADDEIVALAGRASVPVVVVSSDREVRERAESVGALALWSEALLTWFQARS